MSNEEIKKGEIGGTEKVKLAVENVEQQNIEEVEKNAEVGINTSVANSLTKNEEIKNKGEEFSEVTNEAGNEINNLKQKTEQELKKLNSETKETIQNDFGYKSAQEIGKRKYIELAQRKTAQEIKNYIDREEKDEWGYAFKLLASFIRDFKNANTDEDIDSLYQKYMQRGQKTYRYGAGEVLKALRDTGIRNGFVNSKNKKEEDFGFNKKFIEDAT